LSHFSYDLRYSGALGWVNANGMGAFEAEVCAFLLAWTAFGHRKLVKFACLGLMMFSAYCLLFSFSRGGYAAIVVAAIFVGIVKRPMLLVGLVGLGIAWQTLLPESVQQRITMTYDQSDGLEHSSATRLTLWEQALGAFQGNPVIGTGIFTYRYYGGVENLTDTHNLF